jgi:hypothetical protein
VVGDVMTVVLENTLTRPERNLLEMGERLLETRMCFQYVAVGELCEPVERLTGRMARAFTSTNDTEVDGSSVETFILHALASTHLAYGIAGPQGE